MFEMFKKLSKLCEYAWDVCDATERKKEIMFKTFISIPCCDYNIINCVWSCVGE